MTKSKLKKDSIKQQVIEFSKWKDEHYWCVGTGYRGYEGSFSRVLQLDDLYELWKKSLLKPES